MRFLRNFHRMLDEHADPRVNDWFMMSSPLPTLLVVITYVVSVKVSGKKFLSCIEED